MSSEEFEKLHEVYKSLYDELRLMPDRASGCHGEEKKRLVRDFDERFGEAEEMLQGMDKELQSAPSSFRSPMSTKLRVYRRDMGKLQRDMKSSDLGLGFAGRAGDGRHSVYGSQNEQSQPLENHRYTTLSASSMKEGTTSSSGRDSSCS